MGWTSSEITYDVAVSRGFPVWEVIYDDWGNSQPFPAAPAGEAFPLEGAKSLPTIHGVSIGSRSMVDRVFVAYDRQQIISSLYTYYRGASVKAPLVFSQPAGVPAPVVVNDAPPFSAASIAVFGSQSDISLPYETDDSFFFGAFINSLGVINYLRAAAAPDPLLPVTFVPPRLQLYFHLKDGYIPPVARMRQAVSSSSIITLAGGRVFAAAIPVCGRKTVIVDVLCSQAASAIEVGLIQRTGANSTAMETIVGTAAAVPALVPRRFVINPASADWVTIYGTLDAAATGTLNWNVTAED